MPNRWNITNIKHLKNIKHHFKDDDCFKKIRLNIHQKSLNVINDQRGFDPGTTLGKRYRIQMFLSVSFFDMCLTTEVETLYSKADEIYKLSRGSAYWRELSPATNPINKLYTEFMKTMLTNPNIWLDVYNEYINDPLTSYIYLKCFKFSEDIEISEEAFKEIVEGALPKNYVESYKELYKMMVKHISNNLASEIITHKISKEMHIEYIKGTNEVLVKQLENMVKKISGEIFNRILVETDWAKTYLEMLQIIHFEDKKINKS